jgi:hypothetical protein
MSTFRERRAWAILARAEKRRAWQEATPVQRKKSARHARKMADEGAGWEDLVAECWVSTSKARALVRNAKRAPLLWGDRP